MARLLSFVFQKCVNYFKCHSGQAGVIPAFARRRDPESRKFDRVWMPAFAGMTGRRHRFFSELQKGNAIALIKHEV